MSISGEIINVLDALAERFGIVIDWTSKNVFPYLEQLCEKYINYEIATSVTLLIFGIILIFIGKWEIKKMKLCFKTYEENKNIDLWLVGVALVFTTLFTFGIGIGIIMDELFDVITCLTFPEKIIFDELKSLMKTTTSN